VSACVLESFRHCDCKSGPWAALVISPQHVEVRDLHLAFRQHSSLVKHNDIHIRCLLKRFTTTLNEDMILSSETSSNVQCCWCRETNAAGARNDEDSNGKLKRPERPTSLLHIEPALRQSTAFS
jgi:hypothetical protein